MFPNNISQYESSYREGSPIDIANGGSLNLDSVDFDHRGVIIQNKDGTARNLSVAFYGTNFGSAGTNIVTLGLPINTSTFSAPYIIPCRVKSLSIETLANPNNNGIRITLIN